MQTLDRVTATRLLTGATRGDPADAAQLVEGLYAELRSIAAAILRGEKPGATLQPTALVHEAYIRLIGEDLNDPACRARFFALAAKVMRNIVVDHARAAKRHKRGGGWRRTTAEKLAGPVGSFEPEELLALDEALTKLAELDERKAKLVELRFFGGLSQDEAADMLGVARSTAAADWRFARAWLLSKLDGEQAEDDGGDEL